MAKKRKGGKSRNGRSKFSSLKGGKTTTIIKENGKEQWGKSFEGSTNPGKSLNEEAHTPRIKQIISEKQNAPEGGQKFTDRVGKNSNEKPIQKILASKDHVSNKPEPVPNPEKSVEQKPKVVSQGVQKQANNPTQKLQTNPDKSLISEIKKGVKNVNLEKAAKLAGPIVNKLGGKKAAILITAGEVALEAGKEIYQYIKEQKQPDKQTRDDKLNRLKTTTSISTPAQKQGKEVEHSITKSSKKDYSKAVNALKSPQSPKRPLSQSKKPPTPGR